MMAMVTAGLRAREVVVGREGFSDGGWEKVSGVSGGFSSTGICWDGGLGVGEAAGGAEGRSSSSISKGS